MLHTLSIGELGRSLNSGQISSVELTRHFLGRIERLNPALNALITLTAELALAAAADFPRQALHARVLGFKHPTSQKQMRFEAPWPADFARLIASLRALQAR